MSSHIALPSERYFDAAVHVIVHVCQRFNSRLVYDPSYPEIDHSVLRKCDWSKFYRDANEAIPMNAPEPGGKMIDIYIGAMVLKETVYSRDISF